MNMLIAGLVLFLGTHLLTTQRDWRAALRKRLGKSRYKLGYATVSLVGLVLIAVGFGNYRATGMIEVWAPPRLFSHLALLLMLPVFVLLIAAYLPGAIKRIVRHPMLAAVRLWALAHLFSNGDAGSMLLFGGFLAWAELARISLKTREATEGVADLSAMRFGRGDVVAVVAGLTAYLVVAKFVHPLLIGVKVMVA
jgi:uncharacterized membrane protein